MNHDTSLGDPTPDQPSPAAGGVFGNPNGHQHTDEIPTTVRQWTIEEILNQAKLPEKRARICLRADLQAEHAANLAELATLVDARGELIVDDEASVGDVSPAVRARELVDRNRVLEREMAKSMWFPLFRGMTSDDLQVFSKKNMPKGEGADMSEYNTLLIAESSVDPKLSPEDVRALRKKLGSRAIQELFQTATEVNIRGGVDVPKSPVSLRNLTQG